MTEFAMWTLLVLCGVIASHGVQGDDRFLRTTGGMNTPGTPGVRCGSHFSARRGTFYSPNHPNNYPFNADCVWYITPTSGTVLLNFSYVELENGSNCPYDAIYIFDGPSTSSRLLGKLCGMNGTNYHSTGSALTVRFRSDGVISYSGFRADFWVVEGGSCRNRCGDHLGNCSCTSSCEVHRNCCADHRFYCGATDAPTTEAEPSCRYNCGRHLGGCSCQTSCRRYGNCCYDYNYYCAVTTQRPDITLQPSCYNRCGWNMGSCSCQTSCQYYGNCCYDYNYHCAVTTQRPHVTPRPSCYNRCGWNMGSCSCSSSCQRYGNCCYDYNYHCAVTTQRPHVTPRPSCYNKCGWNMGSCSCQTSCQYYGNCCYDYHTTCLPTTLPVRPTTNWYSCRNNCGSYLGGCSCTSSCRNQGNCCYDYNSYCPTVAPTTGQPSCRYNCGWNMGSCSCSSSCRYNGNCCYDYYSYCQTTTPMPTTARPCGGNLYGSGTFSSPNHPNHYHDSAYCVWQLRAANDQRIFLKFTYLQLENCCSCDYIAVYDGPSVGSRYLGKVCNSTLTTFYSTSNYLTVLFRTDGSVVGRGFRADFISSLPPSSGRVDCSSDNMNIVLERTYLGSLGYDGQSLYLDDPHCRPQVSRYQVVFSYPINTCGNVRKFENGRIVYTNTIRAYTSTFGEITRQSHFKMNVGCRMEQDSVSQIMYVVRHHGNSSITGTGRFNTSMDFYTSSSFYYKVTQVPYEVGLNQNLYVQVDLRRGDSSLVLSLDTCVTSPSPHDFHTRPYYLVRNGCPVDSSYRAYTYGSHPYARFSFKAFQFLRATESVYIQCRVLICQASDYNSVCRHGCQKRVTRDLGSEHDSQTLVLGPIRLKGPEKKEETPKQDQA